MQLKQKNDLNNLTDKDVLASELEKRVSDARMIEEQEAIRKK